MQTTLRLNSELYRETKAEAARRGLTVTRFIEEALREQLRKRAEESERDRQRAAEIEDRNQRMEALLERTAHFRMGTKPTREQMNAR